MLDGFFLSMHINIYIHTYRRQDAADLWPNTELCTCLVCIKFNLLYTVALKLCDRIRYEVIDPYA